MGRNNPAADNPPTDQTPGYNFEDVQFSDDTEFFISDKPSLSIVIGEPDPTKGELAPRTVDFVPFWQLKPGVQGEGPNGAIKVGLLATDEGSALKKLSTDPNVQKLDEQDYREFAHPDNRAPY